MGKREQCRLVATLSHIKCTYIAETREFRVTLDGLSREREEAVAYYATDFTDAYDTALLMSHRRCTEIIRAQMGESAW